MKARRTAVAIRYALAQIHWQALHPELMGVTVSIGLCAGEGPLDGKGLQARADNALYAAKRNGRDRIELAVDVAGHVFTRVDDDVSGAPTARIVADGFELTVRGL